MLQQHLYLPNPHLGSVSLQQYCIHLNRKPAFKVVVEHLGTAHSLETRLVDSCYSDSQRTPFYNNLK